ncbi:MAG TPA: lipid biosynthesis B12-binding/radical SAM protein [Verrucomicrobiae bacterium]|nr:lipid biosynthesis B12-binding/radical SAM protein [Verrucomicrobiae bacterium]
MNPRRVLLISSNRCREPYPVFPLGLAHLASALRRAGHTTYLLDSQVTTVPIDRVLAEFRPDIVGISMRNVDDVQPLRRETYFNGDAELCRNLRRHCTCPVVVGGTAFSIFPEQLLTLTGADFGIHGAGEVAFNRLIEALATGADPRDIRGLVYRRGERIVVNPCDLAEPICPEAAERPPELVDFYLRQSSMLNIQTQRGCQLKCCYCTYPLIDGRRCRRRAPDAVAAELEAMQRQGAKHVFITDSVFNTSAEHVAGICEAILRRNLKVQWSCFLRPQRLTRGLMTLMARAGLTHIEFGADSFCDSVLAEYGKALTFDDIWQSSELARTADVRYAHFLICGGPGETRETLQTTFANSNRLQGAIIFALAGMRVYPGTPLLARAQREGVLPPDVDLLPPVYYLSPDLTRRELLRQLATFKRQAPNWLVGAAPPSFAQLSDRLRQRGVVGPLWEYYAPLQRLT